MDKIAPRSGNEAAEFLRTQHTGELKWRALCLALQRTARGLPAIYPSAIAAQLATPESERVYKREDLRRGMVAYSDEPRDRNIFGHIYFIAGRDKSGRILTWSNDVRRSGGVDIVPLDFYEQYWGDTFQFGATWLNGYDFHEFDKPPVETRGSLGSNYRAAVEDIRRLERKHREKGHTILADKLAKDLKVMERRLARYS